MGNANRYDRFIAFFRESWDILSTVIVQMNFKEVADPNKEHVLEDTVNLL
jgi:hypothetical protein